MALSCSKNIIGIIKRNNIKNNGGFYCLNCLHSFRTKNKLESHKKVYKNKDFCNFILLSEDTKVLEFNQYQNITIHYSEDLECIIEKADKSKKILKIHLQQKLADTFHQVFQ